MRKVYETTKVNGKQCKVYRQPETDEYIVRFYSDGRWTDASDYFTGDKEDAIATANFAISGV